MSDWNKRGKEIAKIWYDHGHASASYIIEQEKAMIAEAVREFAKEMCETDADIRFANTLLEERGVEKI